MIKAHMLARFAVLFFFSFFTIAQSHAWDRKKQRVKVDVQAAELSSKVESYLKRELRQLSDVVIVDDDSADWRISVLGAKTKMGNEESGFALSIVTEFLFPSERAIPAAIKGLSLFLGQRLMVGPPQDLKQYCDTIVADFDIQLLEQVRRQGSEAAQQPTVQPRRPSLTDDIDIGNR